METGKQERERAHNIHRLSVLLMCAICVLLNSIGPPLTGKLGIPLFLDSCGTFLAAVLGGYLPGIAVGYATNLLTSISSPINAYYSSLNALIAVLAAWFYQRGYFRKLSTTVIAVLSFAFVGGVIGSLITLLLSGFTFGTGISSPFAMWIHSATGMAPAWAQFLSDICIDIADKALVVTISLTILHFIPDRFRPVLRFEGWKQTPLDRKQQLALDKIKGKRRSLRIRLLVLLVSALMLIALASTTISVVQYRRSAIDINTRLGMGAASLAASIIPGDRVTDLMVRGEDAPGYLDIERRLTRIRDSSPNIQYLYVYAIEENGCRVVFDLDTEEEKGAEPGTVIDFDSDFSEYLPDLLAGRPIEPVISHGAYGYLLTAYVPVYDRNGVCQCYAAADISMNTIRSNEIIFVTKVLSVFMGFFILTLAVGFWMTEYNITLPINAMAMAAGSFAYNQEGARAESLFNAIHDLNIQTGDEIENLYHALEKTTEDMVTYIHDVKQKNDTISKMQNGLILVLADLVESRDKCTGDHVRKTAAYTRIIVNELRREGVYTDQITDEFIDDVVNSAPLHDIGKIHVPDALLNKPGKLTDEEFAKMKEHTTAGSEVIDSAIDTISTDAGYLREARNLAAYHHEKWNGTGYPCGLAGEEIPLSARIMAVADVFDALVSQRSYKKPFTIEKALEIIREGAGNHFDPKVAQAFLNAEDEVRKVANANMAKERAKREQEGTKS